MENNDLVRPRSGDPVSPSENLELQPPRDTPNFFAPHPTKFCLMSVSTFGLYDIYLAYKNWKFVKERDGDDSWPIARALLHPFWHYFLLTEIDKSLENEALRAGAYRAFLATWVVVLSALAFLPDPWWYLSFLSVMGSYPMLRAMRSDEKAATGKARERPFYWANIFAFGLGAPAFVFVFLVSIGYLPGTVVLTGDQLWQKDIDYLRGEEILGSDEEIEYFYSEGLLSISEGGQFISDRYVTSYWSDFETGETSSFYAGYEDIDDISVSFSDSSFEDTVVTVTTTDGTQVELLLSPEAGGDQKFIAAMRAHWNKVRQLSASAQQKFEIRGFSWHLSLDEMRAHAESLGLKCTAVEDVFDCKSPGSSDAEVSIRYSLLNGEAFISFSSDFTNTNGMTPMEIVNFLVDNKPVSEIHLEKNPFFQSQFDFVGRAADGQVVQVTSFGDLRLFKGTLGQGGPTM